MTKEEYAQARDEFAAAARSVSELILWFDLPEAHLEEHDWDVVRALDDYGFYMTGSEYRELLDYQKFLESLSGRNAVRAL